jgi:hypothetical protein
MLQLSGNTINLLHIAIIGPLFYALGTNNYPEKYKHYLTYMAAFIVLYHTYKIYKRNI